MSLPGVRAAPPEPPSPRALRATRPLKVPSPHEHHGEANSQRFPGRLPAVRGRSENRGERERRRYAACTRDRRVPWNRTRPRGRAGRPRAGGGRHRPARGRPRQPAAPPPPGSTEVRPAASATHRHPGRPPDQRTLWRAVADGTPLLYVRGDSLLADPGLMGPGVRKGGVRPGGCRRPEDGCPRRAGGGRSGRVARMHRTPYGPCMPRRPRRLPGGWGRTGPGRSFRPARTP